MNDFKMVPLPFDKLPIIEPLVEAMLKSARLEGFGTVEDCMDFVALGYRMQAVAAYVDTLESPKRCLVLMLHPNIFSKGKSVTISLIYADPAARGDRKVAREMYAVAERFARHHGADQLFASSWIFRGSKDIGSIIRASGFEEQEMRYVKRL